MKSTPPLTPDSEIFVQRDLQDGEDVKHKEKTPMILLTIQRICEY